MDGGLANPGVQAGNVSRVHALVTASVGGDPSVAGELAIDFEAARYLLLRADQAAAAAMAARPELEIEELADAAGRAERERVLAAVTGAADLAYERARQAGGSAEQARELEEKVRAQLDEAAEDAGEEAWAGSSLPGRIGPPRQLAWLTGGCLPVTWWRGCAGRWRRR